MDLSMILTEGRNPETLDIDNLSTLEMLKKINKEDKKVALAVERELMNIARMIDKAAEKLKKGGRLIYMGAGTSGRLGILDASECPPTYGTAPEIVQGIIAGGDKAIMKAVEGAEDSLELGRQDLINIDIAGKDVVVGITASGRTPYVLGGLSYAREVGALTVGLSCNSDCKLKGYTDLFIAPVVGEEVIMGSTRMKAGSAQKMVLNMISTGIMIKLGKAYSNLMVDLQPTNKKLVERSKRIVRLATGADEVTIENTLKRTNYKVKLAIFMILTNLNEFEAEIILSRNEGYIAKALKEFSGREN